NKLLIAGLTLATALAVAGPGRTEPASPAKPIDRWVEGLRAPDVAPRREAATALFRLGPAAREAIPALIEALRHDKDPVGRRRAAEALGRIGPAAKEAVGALVEVLQKDPDDTLRYHVATALGDIGPEARAAIPALLAFLTDPDRGDAEAAAVALGHIGRDTV